MAAVWGAGIGFGLLLGWWGLRGVRVVAPLKRLTATSGRSGGVVVARVLGGVVLGVVVMAVTGWPVAGVCVVVGVAAWPVLFAADDRPGHIEKLEAIAVWTESVRDTLAAAAGLRQAALVAAEQAPGPIAEQLETFRRRVRAEGLVQGLEGLAEDLDDPVGDLVVAALVNASRLPAGDLGPLLGRLADSIRDDVRMHQRISVSRQRIRTSSKIVSVCMALTFGVLLVGGGDLLDPYSSTAGQIWLGFVAIVVVGGAVGLRRMGALEAPVRFTRRVA
ncbi:MAG: hypothetical protein RIE08_02290 [Acidimicrobiales bacterium]